ncbi:MAG: cell division protein ZapE [Gammaproteobacteria bacterium]|jgi:cell division protein ZapE
MSELNDHDNADGVAEFLSPQQRYERDLAAGELMPDPAQAYAIAHVERLYRDLGAQAARRGSFLDRLLRRAEPGATPIRGLYLWGRVGRGKTYIVDTFYDCVRDDRKLRIHFHSFMRRVHGELKQLSHESDPLSIIGRRWASDIRLLCLDEFHVGDITDAMILANLLRALFEHGVTLVATSNEAPSQLYRDGLQRDRFLPAIALLEQRLEIVELAGDLDYRLRALEQAGVYYTPHNADVGAQMARRFRDIAPEPGMRGGGIDIDGRLIPTVRHADGVVWFDFATLCGGPRATGDYIEIALCHHTIVLSDVPILDRDASDAARRFINLIDELYDRNVKLIASAAAAPEDLYSGTRLAEPFKRTASRLREMQSHDYLARPHLCD